jgi:hypothetical protein
MTYKQLIEVIASNFREENNVVFKRKVGILVQSYREELIKQYHTKYGHFPPNAIKELKWIPMKEMSLLEDTKANSHFKEGIIVYRSEHKIPQGVSFNQPFPYIFVGEPSREDSLDYLQPEDYEFAKTRRFQGSFYSSIEGYLYTFNYTKKAVNIRYVPADLDNFISITDIDGNLCFEDYEIESMFVNTIRTLIYNELARFMPNNDKEIEINENKDGSN